MRSQSMNKMRCLHWYRFCSELENIEIFTQGYASKREFQYPFFILFLGISCGFFTLVVLEYGYTVVKEKPIDSGT